MLGYVHNYTNEEKQLLLTYGFTPQEVEQMFDYWYNELEDYCKVYFSGGNNQEIWTINKPRLIKAVISYFGAIGKEMQYHSMDHVNRIKIFAYSYNWIMRFSPVQLKVEFEGEPKPINVAFVVNHLCGKFVGVQRYNSDPAYEEWLEGLRYFYTYRHYDAQTIESQIESLLVGMGNSRPFNPYKKDEMDPKSFDIDSLESDD